MNLLYHIEQLQFMKDLAAWRPDFLNPIFLFLNYADTPYFIFVLIPLIWIGFSWHWGIRLYYLIGINGMINSMLKMLIGWPRPCVDLPELGMLCPTSFGFPSGGAQTSILLAALLIYTWRSSFSWVIGIFYFLLVSFSRLYLGVHYPIDILGGWIVGLILFGIYVVTINPIEKFLRSRSLEFCLVLSIMLPLLLMAVTTATPFQRPDAILLGLGVYLSLKYGLYLAAPQTIWKGCIRGVIGVLGVFLIYAVMPKEGTIFLIYVIASLWLSLIASPFCGRILKL